MTDSVQQRYRTLFAPHQPDCVRIIQPEWLPADIELWMLRLDQIGDGLAGNKWYKLKYNLHQAIRQGCRSVLSFGGAYSNHLHALAWAGDQLGLKTIGVVRGEADYANNPTLSDARRWGMRLHFVDRKTYRLRHDPSYLKALHEHFQPDMIVPEGGSNLLALQGCREILSDTLKQQLQPDLVVLPCGTGATLAGLVAGHPDIAFLGIPVLQQAGFLQQDISALVTDAAGLDVGNWSLDLNGAQGGYGKVTPDLIAFINRFREATGIPLDPVYSGKMMFHLSRLIQQKRWPAGSRLLVLHTGGLQGCRGFAQCC